MTAAGNFESKICTQYCGNTYSAQVNWSDDGLYILCSQGKVAFDGVGDRAPVLRFFQYQRKLHEYCARVNQSVATVHVHTTKDSLAIGQVAKCS